MSFARSTMVCFGSMCILPFIGCGGGGSSTTATPPTSTYVLTVTTVNPNSGVAIAVTPADINGAGNGTTSFTRTYNSGTAITLTAPATAGGNVFLSWSGCSSSNNLTCNVTMISSYTVTATYTTPVINTLTVNSVYPSSGVTISASPADNNNKASGATSFSLSYNSGTSVTLTAPAAAGGNSFLYWSECNSTSTVTCTVNLNANTTVTANYAAPYSGKTYYVSGSGSDSADGLSTNTPFATLQHAADLTGPGDTVNVMNGTYCSNNWTVLAINNPGTPNAWIKYQAYPGATPIITVGANWAGIAIDTGAAYIEVSGFTVIGNNANITLAEAQQYESDPQDHPELNGNCILVDGNKTETQPPAHINILNNILSECPGGGIAASYGDYVTASGNTVSNNSWYGAYGTSAISFLSNYDTDPSDTSTQYKMIISNNVVYGNREYIPWVAAGTITDGEGIIIDSNKNSSYDTSIPWSPYTSRTLVANNVIYANGSAAVEVFQSAHVDVVNNSSYGDVLTSVESGRGELNIQNADDVNVLNNIFYSNAGQNPVVANSSTLGSSGLDYNLYYGGSNALSGVSSGSHDLVADPLYVDPADATPANVNLKVAATSPAVGSGTANLAPATDINSNPRPGSKGIDRGAYQQP